MSGLLVITGSKVRTEFLTSNLQIGLGPPARRRRPSGLHTASAGHEGQRQHEWNSDKRSWPNAHRQSGAATARIASGVARAMTGMLTERAGVEPPVPREPEGGCGSWKICCSTKSTSSITCLRWKYQIGKPKNTSCGHSTPGEDAT